MTTLADREKASLSEMEAPQSHKTIFEADACKGREKWPTQCQPRPFYSQAQKQPCCLYPSGAPNHLPCPALSAGVNLIPRTLPEVTSQAQLQLKSLVVKGLTIPANYSPKNTIAKTARQCQQLLQALGYDKSFNDYAKQSSTNSLLNPLPDELFFVEVTFSLYTN